MPLRQNSHKGEIIFEMKMENVKLDSNAKFLHFEVYEEGLPEQYLKKAEIELGDTRHRREQSLKKLKELFSESGNGNLKEVDQRILVMYLRAKKFNPRKAFDILQSFLRNKKKIYTLESLSDLNPIREIWKHNTTGLLPYREASGRAIVVHLCGNWDPEKLNMDEILAAGLATVIIALFHPMTQVNGFILILDLKDFGFRHLKRFTPTYAYLLIHGLQNCLPGRCKGIHVLNENIYYKYAFTLIKPFLSEKFKKRIFLHGDNMTSLHKYISPQILNSEFDGCLDLFDNSYTLRLSQRNEEKAMYFLKLN